MEEVGREGRREGWKVGQRDGVGGGCEGWKEGRVGGRESGLEGYGRRVGLGWGGMDGRERGEGERGGRID